MRVFVAGATGVIGKCLVPMLLAAGHEVVGSTQSSEKVNRLTAMGAESVVFDLLNREAVMKAVVAARPDAVVHQATSLARLRNLRNFDREFELTNRLRTEGTENLLAAAQKSGARRFVAQSFTGWPNKRSGGRIKSEADPLDANPLASMRRALEAIQRLEVMVCAASELTGVVLRYGLLYGPGTSVGQGGKFVEAVQHRKFPIIGGGAGVWSWIHIDDCARATQIAVESAISPGIYNIVDDEPAEVSVWLPYLAEALDAKAPLHVPAWIGRLLVGEAIVLFMTKIRGSSNALAKRVLKWQPQYASWRQGFRSGLE